VSLLDLQRGLSALVAAQAAGRASGVPEGLELTAGEQAWLEALRGTPGLKVTADIQRWWRETRLRWTARLTLGALTPTERSALIARYLSSVPCPSLFFVPEAVSFLAFTASALEGRPDLTALIRLEREMLLAREARTTHARPPLPEAAPASSSG
jgi:hypothetical protein